MGLGPHPQVVVKHQEGKHGNTSPPEGEKDPSPIWGLPTPEFQPWEEEFPKNQTIKISGDSGALGETEGH